MGRGASLLSVLFLVVLFVGTLICAVTCDNTQPQKIGVFDKKEARKAAIEQSWLDEGYKFQTITDVERPYGFCMFGKPYEVKFNITIPEDGAFVRVDQQTGYAGVLCNLDHTDIEFHFSSQSDATSFQRTTAVGHPILTGLQGKAECTPNKGMFKRVASVAQEIVQHTNSPFGATTYSVRVRSFKAAYDHTIKSGTIQFGNAAADGPFADVCNKKKEPEGAHFCLGINTNEHCTASAGPIVFYQNEYITLQCEDCWLAFSMDVGLKMMLEDFLLYDSHFAFSNMVVNGALIAQMLAQYHWGLSYDATIPVIGPVNIVQFWLGPIPIIIGFELPLQRVADASFDASAEAEAGAQLQWSLGDYKVLWNPVQGWRADKNEPGLIYRPVVSGEAQFNGNANFGLAPSLTANLDSFFTTQVEFSAMLHANVQGSTTSKQICADVNYAVIADGSATLEISIPWIDVDESWTWSHTWFSKQGTIAQACTKVKHSNTSVVIAPPTEPKRLPAPDGGKPPKPVAQPAQQAYPLAPLRGPSGPLKRLQGQHSGCWSNRGYAMSYDVLMAESYNLLNLDTFPGFKKLTCNAGGNNFRIEFHHDSDRKEFFRMAQSYTTFLTGSQALGARCGPMYDTTVFLFRVLSLKDTTIPLIKYQGEVEVSASRYDEVFHTANISFVPSKEVQCGAPEVQDIGASRHICLGVNTNAACDAAKKSMLMYNGEYLTVECSNCYFALQTDIFFELHIKDYWVQTLSGGYKNMTMDAAMVLDILAHIQYNSGTNITEDAVPPTTILDFAIGPIPIRLWFEIPLRRLAEVEIDIKAELTAGAIAQWNIGDHYVTYTAGKGWSHVSPHPTLVWKPHLGQIQAEFNATAVLGLIPTFAFHVDSVFWTTLTVDPEITLAANGSLAKKQVCASAQAQVTATAYAELDINVPFIYLHMDAWWGPQQVYNSGVKRIFSVCHKFAEEDQAPPPLVISDF